MSCLVRMLHKPSVRNITGSDLDVATWQSSEDAAVERAVQQNDVRTLAHEARACLTKYVSLSLVLMTAVFSSGGVN